VGDKENYVLSGENIVFYKIEKNENSVVGTKSTGENGDFFLSTAAPETEGVFRFAAVYSGGENYAQSQNDALFRTLNTLLLYSYISLFSPPVGGDVVFIYERNGSLVLSHSNNGRFFLRASFAHVFGALLAY